jgi:6-phosphogluconolactonase
VLGSAIPAGVKPRSITVDPSGLHAYVVNSADDTVSQYNIGANGLLTAMGTPTVQTGTTPWQMVIHPNGGFAYVTNKNDGNVWQYAIDPNSGELSSIGSPVLAGDLPFGLTIAPNGLYAYVANFGSDTTPGTTVSQYTIAQSGGSKGLLTPIAGAPTVSVGAGAGPLSITINAASSYAYVTNYYGNNVSQFSIEVGTGKLTAVGIPLPAGNNPWPVTIDPTGQYAYWSILSARQISQCTFGTSAELICTLVQGGAVQGTQPQIVAVDPSSRFAYVVNGGDNTVSQFTIGAGSGALTPIGVAPTVPTGTAPQWMVIAR